MATPLQVAIAATEEALRNSEFHSAGLDEKQITRLIGYARSATEGHTVEYSVHNDGTYHLCNVCLRYALWDNLSGAWRHADRSDLPSIRKDIQPSEQVPLDTKFSTTGRTNEPWKGVSAQSEWETTRDYVTRLIGEAVGAGSMAWPAVGGVFLDVYAKSIVDDTSREINHLLEIQGKRLQDTVTLETHNAVVAEKEMLLGQLAQAEEAAARNMDAFNESQRVVNGKTHDLAVLQVDYDDTKQALSFLQDEHDKLRKSYMDLANSTHDKLQELTSLLDETGEKGQDVEVDDVHRPLYNLVDVIRATKAAAL